MKRTLLILFTTVWSLCGYAQMKNDTFYFDNDTALNYIINPTWNDNILDDYSLTNLKVISGNFTAFALSTENAATIQVQDSDTSSYMGILRYTIVHKHSQLTDTAWVVFYKNAILPTVYPGDVNQDGVVNHFDLLPIGIKYGSMGSPRHEKDKSIVFLPTPAGNWMTATRNVNDKNIDINGDGRIDTLDVQQLYPNFGKSWKSSSIVTSAPSFYTFLTAKMPQDTIDYSEGKISLPVKIESSTYLPTYGIAFNYQLKYWTSSGVDSLYSNKSSVSNFNLWAEKPLLFYTRNGGRDYVSAVRYNGKNGSSDGYAGVVEIVVEDVILGLANIGNIGKLTIDFSEVLLIDNEHTPIDISPKPYTFYLRKVASSLSNANRETIEVYPNIVQDYFIIEKNTAHTHRYEIFNQMGQQIQSGTLSKKQTKIQNITWTSGLYYLKIDSHPSTIKLLKQ